MKLRLLTLAATLAALVFSVGCGGRNQPCSPGGGCADGLVCTRNNNMDGWDAVCQQPCGSSHPQCASGDHCTGCDNRCFDNDTGARVDICWTPGM